MISDMVLDKKSWHYRLANTYGDYQDWGDGTDMCTYTKHVLRGLFLVIATTTVAGAVTGVMFDTFVAWIAWMLFIGEWVDPTLETFKGFLIIFGLVAMIMGIAGYVKAKEHLRRKYPTSQGAPFVVQAYRSWKDKYCVRVTFKGISE
jgi:uncharacterized membrane protein YidH (DUF202 family)